jgi:hypothetical protein
MLTACHLQHTITYYVNFFNQISQRQRKIYFHRCVILLGNVKMFNKVADKIKVKVHPRTSHENLEGKYKYSSTLSLSSVLDCGGW